MPDDLITIGQIGGAFGVRGELRLKSFCAQPEAIADYGPYVLSTGERLETLVLTGQVKGGYSARMDGVATKEDADALKGVQIQVPRSALPALPDDEFYHSDLMGLAVVDTGGRVLGTVKAVHDHGAGDLLEIVAPGAPATVLLPFTRAAVPTVDLASGRLVADPPEGLFPEED